MPDIFVVSHWLCHRMSKGMLHIPVIPIIHVILYTGLMYAIGDGSVQPKKALYTGLYEQWDIVNVTGEQLYTMYASKLLVNDNPALYWPFN